MEKRGRRIPTGKFSPQNLDRLATKLAQKLVETYGANGYVRIDGQKHSRFSVGLGLRKLGVSVLLSEAEIAQGEALRIQGQTFDEFISLIPEKFEGVPVEVFASRVGVAQ